MSACKLWICNIFILKQNRPFPVILIPKIIYFLDKIFHNFFQKKKQIDRKKMESRYNFWEMDTKAPSSGWM